MERVNATLVEFVEANPDHLAIVRLFLEKFEKLNEGERKMFGDIIRMITYPPVMRTR